MKQVIELKDIEKEYGREVKQKVLKGINLQFEENSFNSIIGQSGSGKSTLLNIIGTLDKPTRGSVTINGRRTDVLSKNQLAEVRNQEIGFIFQFHYLLPEFSVLENVLMPYRIRHRKIPGEVKERAIHLLERVGLKDVIRKNALAISGGQQQRTAIARALINEPKIILADEPTGNLDSESTEIVFRLLKDLNDEFGTTFVVITHNPRVAEKTDRIIEMRDGRVISDILT